MLCTETVLLQHDTRFVPAYRLSRGRDRLTRAVYITNHSFCYFHLCLSWLHHSLIFKRKNMFSTAEVTSTFPLWCAVLKITSKEHAVTSERDEARCQGESGAYLRHLCDPSATERSLWCAACHCVSLDLGWCQLLLKKTLGGCEGMVARSVWFRKESAKKVF